MILARDKANLSKRERYRGRDDDDYVRFGKTGAGERGLSVRRSHDWQTMVPAKYIGLSFVPLW